MKRDYKTAFWREYFRKYHHQKRAKKLQVIYKTQGRPEFKEWRREYDKNYYQAHKDAIRERRRLEAARHPGKARARSKLKYAVRVGRIKRQPCKECGGMPSQAHHTDYRKPLDVQWLCSKHHGEVARAVV